MKLALFILNVVLACLLLWRFHTLRTSAQPIPAGEEEPPWTAKIGDSHVVLCNSSHLCSERSPSCVNGPITLHVACYCDTLCVHFGDCCIDYDEVCKAEEFATMSVTMSTTTNTTIALTTGISRGDPLGVPLELYECNTLSYASPNMLSGYWVVSKCSGTPDPSCENDLAYPSPDVDDERFRRTYIPVTSQTTKIAYKNVYCARCNGDDGLLYLWQLKVDNSSDSFRNYAEFSLVHKLFVFIISHKTVTWFPPSGIDTKLIRSCSLVDESPCNDDNLWETQQADCSYVSAYVRRLDLRHSYSEIYRKSFCFDCIENNGFLVTCAWPIPAAFPRQSAKEGNIDEFLLVPISVVVDFTGSIKTITKEERQTEVMILCEKGQVFDPNSESCIALSCGEGLVKEGDECNHGNGYCPDRVQEWSLDFHPDARKSCAGKLYIIFDCLKRENLPVELIDILSSSNNRYRCHYNLLVNMSMVPDTINSSHQLDDFMVKVRNAPKSRFYDACIILNAELYQSCKSKLEKQCDGLLHPFPFDTVWVGPGGKRHYYINDTDKWYSENIAVERITYDDYDKRTRTVHVCDKTLLQCPFVVLNQSLFIDELDLSGYIKYWPTGQTIPPEEYRFLNNGYVHVCNFFATDGFQSISSTVNMISFSLNQSIVSTVGCCLSLVALFITFSTYARFRVLRRCLCNKLIMCLCAAIFMGQLLLLLGGLTTSIHFLCTVVSALTHYAWLSAFALTFTLAFDLNRTFGSDTINRSCEDEPKVLILYLVNSFGTPLLIVITCLIIQFQKKVSVIYARDGICWISDHMSMLLAFGLPVAITLCLNMVLFIHTVIGIFKTKRLSRKLLLHDIRKPTYVDNMKELLIYFKISTLMGFTWITGFIAAYVKTTVTWYIFVILNSLQGAFIFLAFMCNGRVWQLWTQGVATKSMSTSIRKSSNAECADNSQNQLTYQNNISNNIKNKNGRNGENIIYNNGIQNVGFDTSACMDKITAM